MARACQQTVPSKAVVQSDKTVIGSGTPTTCRIYWRSQAHETVDKREIPESVGCVGLAAVELKRSSNTCCEQPDPVVLLPVRCLQLVRHKDCGIFCLRLHIPKV